MGVGSVSSSYESLDVISSRYEQVFNTKFDQDGMREVYNNNCEGGVSWDGAAESRYVGSLGSLLRDIDTRAAVPTNPYSYYARFLSEGRNCPENSPARLREGIREYITTSLQGYHEGLNMIAVFENLTVDVSEEARKAGKTTELAVVDQSVLEVEQFLGPLENFIQRVKSEQNLTYEQLLLLRDVADILKGPKSYGFKMALMGLIEWTSESPKFPRTFDKLVKEAKQFDPDAWERYIRENHQEFDGHYFFLGNGAYHDTDLTTNRSLLSLLNHGESSLVRRVLNLRADVFRGNKIVEAWVHMVAQVTSYEQLRGVRRAFIEDSLGDMEAAAREIENSGNVSDKMRALESMEQNLKLCMARLLNIEEQKWLDAAESVQEYLEGYQMRKGGGSNGSSGMAPSSPSTPPALISSAGGRSASAYSSALRGSRNNLISGIFRGGKPRKENPGDHLVSDENSLDAAINSHGDYASLIGAELVITSIVEMSAMELPAQYMASF